MKSIFVKVLALLSLMVIMGCMGLMEIGTPQVKPIIGNYYTIASIEDLDISKTDARNPSPPGDTQIWRVQDFGLCPEIT